MRYSLDIYLDHNDNPIDFFESKGILSELQEFRCDDLNNVENYILWF